MITAERPHGRQRWQWPLHPVRKADWAAQRPAYAGARPALIEAAVKRARARTAGRWYVLGASADVRADRPLGVTVAGVELVAWRDEAGRLVVGPGACPHLGAPLALARADRGALVCRWHGLRICPGAERTTGWRALPGHDDGVLAWVRLDVPGDDEEPLAEPVIPVRPRLDRAVHAVTTVTGGCEPEDVLANRLDPWHGSWFHPYSFTRLSVLRAPAETGVTEAEDRFEVAVTFQVGPRLGVPVRAEFTCPGPRTVVMRITEGEGAGSTVETHATPLGRGPDGRPRTAVIEAVIATSDRAGWALARRAAPALRPVMRRAAARLWRDDLAYAERRYHLRSGA